MLKVTFYIWIFKMIQSWCIFANSVERSEKTRSSNIFAKKLSATFLKSALRSFPTKWVLPFAEITCDFAWLDPSSKNPEPFFQNHCKNINASFNIF